MSIYSHPSPRNQGSFDRYDFVDNAKAIGMVLVVLGHSRGLPDYIVRLIFSFHVPLFFFISGFLIKSSKLDVPIFRNAKKVLQTLAIPYVLFFLLAFLYWLATRNIGAKALLTAGQAWYSPILGLFTGLESDLFVDPPLWFFPCLIMTAITYHASRKFLTLTAATCIFGALAFVITLFWKDSPFRLPLSLDSMWVALSFYAIGQYVREKNFFSNIKPGYLFVIFIIAVALLVYAEGLNGKVDFANMHFGRWPALYMLTALLGIISTFAFSALFPVSRISAWISKNTLTIFPVHFIFLSLIRGVMVSLHAIPGDYAYGIEWSVVSSVLAIMFCVPFVFFLRRLPVANTRRSP
ncbi:acyltransferase [Collimonas sp. OK607]|uniref:acyltransferase family protein n=1 Tax=Collimonas sp. OK607 TaxID=1798194 RepID=UPI0008E76496|nr:acyltransferase family protein [Collimonas sp. OK607]SFA69897.1 acyltransferase [Collimonas sp. OK607]